MQCTHLRHQTPLEGFYLQVIHKYSVPPSERCQTPFEGIYINTVYLLLKRCQTPHKHSVPLSEILCQTPFEKFFVQ